MRPSYVYRAPAAYLAPQFYRRAPRRKWTPSLYDPVTEQQVTIGTLSALSPLYGNTPAVTTGDLWILPLVTSPGGYAITALTDGTFSYDALGDQSRQQLSTKVWDDSVGAYFETEEVGDYFTIYVNNSVWVQLTTIPSQTWYTNIAIDPVVLSDYGGDPDDQDDTLVWAIGLPAGLTVELVTYNPGTPAARTVWQIQGTPTTVSAATLVGTAEDPAGGEGSFAAFAYTITASVQIPLSTQSGDYALAVTTLSELGLETTLIPQASDTVPVDGVISTTPAYPAYVIPGSTVSITVAGRVMPDVEGTQLALALDQLIGITIVVEYEPNAVTSGVILSQSEEAGTLLTAQDTVTLVVSTGIGAVDRFRVSASDYVMRVRMT